MISGATKVYVILGHPIAQVRSPEFFNAYFTQAAIDAVLVPIDVKPGDFSDTMAVLRRLGNLHGVIATVPHKAALLAAVDAATDRARLCNGVNVARPDAQGRWHGDMLDGRGFLNGLAAHRIDPKGASVHMVGAGGVGSAIAVALAGAGIASLTIRDLDWYRAQSLATLIGGHFSGMRVRAVQTDPPPGTMVINATPLGMQPADPLPYDAGTLGSQTIACDVISKPAMSRFLLAAAAKGSPILSGKDLFEGQVDAMKAFFDWRS